MLGDKFLCCFADNDYFALLGREVTFFGKYLHCGTIFLRQILFYFFLILWSSAKAYLSCKTFYHKVALDVQLMILVLFFFEEKMFCSRDI